VSRTPAPRSRIVAEVLVDILRDSAPQPWRTKDLQRAFAPRDRQRVYLALRSLARRGTVWRSGLSGAVWWTCGDPPPACARCSLPARRLVRTLCPLPKDDPARAEGKCWMLAGGWSCAADPCTAAAVGTAWPWPDGADLVELVYG
jgi:hypothetical protein